MTISETLVERSRASGRYFTGKPCVRGHLSERLTSNRGCIACDLERSARDPNRAERTKRSNERLKTRRTEAARNRYLADPISALRYDREYRLRNLEKMRAYETEQREKHAAHRRAYSLKRYENNREAVRSASRTWDQKNPHLVAAKTARRRAAKLQATPLWANLDKIAAFYKEAQRLTRITGIPYQVDHIIPLRSPVVCGLHVETNLQVIPASLNASKKNKLIDAALRIGEE